MNGFIATCINFINAMKRASYFLDFAGFGTCMCRLMQFSGGFDLATLSVEFYGSYFLPFLALILVYFHRQFLFLQ
jgi:hypothetical protein